VHPRDGKKKENKDSATDAQQVSRMEWNKGRRAAAFLALKIL